MKTCILIITAWVLSLATALAAPSITDKTLRAREIASGISLPTAMAFIGPGDILVLEKNSGIVRRVQNGAVQASPVLDLNVASGGFDGEMGLLGVAVHPNFATTHPYVYLYLSESSGGDGDFNYIANRVYRYTWNPGNGTLTSPLLIIDLGFPVGTVYHVGGTLAFGRDGKLYGVIGDTWLEQLGFPGQLQNVLPASFFPNTSMIFRVNDDGSVPNDNPFSADPMMPGIEKVFAYGIRNSFGLAFDTHPMSSGALWDSENGEDFYDEINRVDAGFNSGWLKVMGPASRTPGFNPATDLFIVTGSQYADPAFSWKNGVGVTALAFLNSTQIGPQYEHDLFVADFNNGNIYRFELNGLRDALVLPGTVGDKVADTNAEFKSLLFGTGFNGITDLKVGPDGLLYVLSIATGKIYVIEPAPGPLKITSKPFPKGEQNVAYSVTISASGGTGTRTFSLFSGVLPTGLNLVGDTISGTPMVVGNFPITIQVTDGAAASVRKNFKITILPAVVVTTTALKDGKLNKKYNFLLKATGGKKPFTWVLDAGSPSPPPTGLNVDPKGKVTGIPTAAGGPVTFRVRVTDILGGTDTQDLDLTIQP